MKRLLIFLVLTLSVAISVFAVDSSDISFVSYEQGWLDSKGTLSIRLSSSYGTKTPPKCSSMAIT